MKLPETACNDQHLNYCIYANEAISWPKDIIAKVKLKPGYIDVLFENRFADLSGFFGSHSRIHQNFIKNLENFDEDQLAREVLLMIESGISIYCIGDEDYPSRLLDIPDPPLALYHIGSLFDFENCIAISGRRDPSTGIPELTKSIAGLLVRKGFTVVSGLAEGIDTAAHEGALGSEQGKTIAVLANGLQTVIPRSNMELAKRVVKRGCVLSEKALYPNPQKYDFIRRNRIISGISKWHIIIESSGKGGTQHQFELAKEQDKRILIYVGDKLSEESKIASKEMVEAGGIPFRSLEELEEKVLR